MSNIASSLAVPMIALVRALRAGDVAKRELGALNTPWQYLYKDTAQRQSMRALLEGAAAADAEVLLAFLKADDTLRYMRAAPCPGVDDTTCYMTVQDLDLSEQAGRKVYRRVRLDTIAAAQVSFSAA